MGERPNVLFIISDDHRHSAIHSFGNAEVNTPVLDRLVENGVSFTGTHIMGGFSGAVCAPSRASVHSSANVFKSGGIFEINPDLVLMPEYLKQNGYQTYAVGKWHNDTNSFNRCFSGGAKLFFGGMSNHYDVPVHEFDPNGMYSKGMEKVYDKHSSELFADAAISFLKNNNKEEPFFLYVANTAPHDPRTAPKEYHELYKPENIKIPPNFASTHPFDNGEMNVRDEGLAEYPRNEQEVQSHIADYYAMITHLDAQVGRILQTLEETGQRENTILIYTADHGLSLGQHGLMGKQNMYDHSVRIPLIMSGPGLPKGKKVEALTYQIDIFPTLCDLLGISPPDTVEGICQTPLITGEKEIIRNHVYSVYRDIQRMVKNHQWKLIRYYRQSEREEGTDYVQLFDLKSDPWETINLANNPEYRDILGDLANTLSDWQRSVGDPLGSIPVLLDKTLG